LYPAETNNTVRAWVAQQQSQKSPRDAEMARSEAEFEIPAQTAGTAQPADSVWGLLQLRLPNLMGSSGVWNLLTSENGIADNFRISAPFKKSEFEVLSYLGAYER
jgi:hypothetical protein